MRSCIYCGKELAKDEKCDCYRAQARRNENAHQPPPNNNTQNTGSNNYYHKKNTNSYHTGYTRKENPFKSAWNRYCTRKRVARTNHTQYKKSPKRNILFDFISFFKSPTTTVADTAHISIGFVFVIAAASGALLGISLYLILMSSLKLTSTLVAPIPPTVVTMNDFVSGFIFSLIAGMIIGIILYSLYCLSFYLINRLVFREPTKYSDFFSSLSLCPLPIAVFSVLGAIFGLVSSSALAIIVLCGLMFSLLLTYEVLKIKWIGFSQNQIMYGTLLSFFIFCLILSSLVFSV